MEKYKYKRYGDELRFNYCPICKKERAGNPDFTINILKGVYFCHSTGESGTLEQLKKDYDFDFNLRDIPTQEKEHKPKKDFNKIFEQYADKHLNTEWLEYLSRRGISPKYLKQFCRLGKNNSMVIPITDRKNIVALKYRTIDKKISSEKDSQTDYLMNWHLIKTFDYLIIVEGEIDLLSVIEAGYDNVVSLPFGATNIKSIENQKEWIEQFSKIIIATDNDQAGEESRNKIIKVLNNKNLYKVEYGKYKDFNEVLMTEGKEKIQEIIKKVVPLPTDKNNFFGEKGRFLFDIFSKYLKEKYNIIKIDNELYCYNNGIYEKDSNLEKNMIDIIPNLKNNQRLEVLKYLNIICEDKKRDTRGLIAFANGIFDVEQSKLLPFSSDIIITNRIPWNYNPTVQSELMENTLNKFACNDKDIRTLIDEVIGYTFYSKNELGKSFIIIGDKANGKSTFLKIMMYLLGENNISALSLEDITNSRFRLYEVNGKLLNIGDDIGSSYIPESEVFRKVVTGDVIVAEKKGKDPIKFNCYAKFLFSANEIPKIKDPTGATARRIIIIPFKNSFTQTNKDYDPYFLDKIKNPECMEYLIKVGIEGLKRVLKNKGFSETQETQQLLKEFNENNNPVIEYVDYLENEGKNPMKLEYIIENYSCMTIYEGTEWSVETQKQIVGFKNWSVSNGLKTIALKSFIKSMKLHFKLETGRKKKNGRKETYFFIKGH